MDSALIVCGLVGVVMFVVGLARIAADPGHRSTFRPAALSLRPGTAGFFELVQAHIREGWPETKLDAVLFYGGLAYIGCTLLIFLPEALFGAAELEA